MDPTLFCALLYLSFGLLTLLATMDMSASSTKLGRKKEGGKGVRCKTASCLPRRASLATTLRVRRVTLSITLLKTLE